jgi:hypothetical protein
MAARNSTETVSSGTAPSSAESSASILAQVKQMVDDRLGQFTTAFFSDQRATSVDLAGKIDAISDALFSGCGDDAGLQSGAAASNLQMPKSRVDVLDRMRKGRPALYSAVRESASNVVFARPLMQRAAIEAAIKAIKKVSQAS